MRKAAEQTLLTQINAVDRTLFEEDQQVRRWFDTPIPDLGERTPSALMAESDSRERLHAYVISLADLAIDARNKEIHRIMDANMDRGELSSEEFWMLKRLQQKNDQLLIATGKISPGDLCILSPERLRGATLRWPDTSLVDEDHDDERRG